VLDPIALAQEITPYMVAAVGAYGTAVLSRAEDQAAGATVSLGQRLIHRLVHGAPDGTTEVTGAISKLIRSPADADLQAFLRVAVADALRADPATATEVASWPRPGGVTISAAGSRSVAAGTINGMIVTGDIRTGRQ
jgi:hypothetical protein